MAGQRRLPSREKDAGDGPVSRPGLVGLLCSATEPVARPVRVIPYVGCLISLAGPDSEHCPGVSWQNSRLGVRVAAFYPTGSEMFDKVWDYLPKPRPTDLAEAFDRLRISFNRTLNEGVGILLLGALLATISAISFRAYVNVAGTHDRLVEEYVSAILGSAHEPRKRARHFGLTAAVMAKIRTADECPGGPKCQTTNRAHDIFRELSSAVTSPEEIAKEQLAVELALAGAERRAVDHWLDLAIEKVKSLRAQLRNGTTIDLPVASFSPDKYRSGYEEALGPPGCDRNGWSTLLVSSQAPSSCYGMTRCYGKEVSEGILLSNLLDQVAEFFSEVGDQNAEASFIQAYFISAHDVFRIWRTGSRNSGACDDFPAAYRWASASYFEHFVDQRADDSYITRPYIDLADQGFVQTRCTPIEAAPSGRTEGDGSRPRSLAGVFCTDHAIFKQSPASGVDPSICENPLLDVRVISLPTRGLRVRLGDVDVFQCKASSPERTSARERREVVDAVNAFLKGRRLDALKRSVNRVSFGETNDAYVFPLETRKDRWWALLVRPRVPSRPTEAAQFAGLSIAAGVAAIGALISAMLFSRRAQAANEKVALLRNVATGVIVVDSKDVVTEANDRAEELLDLPIPKVGVGAKDDEGEKRRFAELIEDSVIEVVEGGRLKEEMTPYSKIPEKRRQGKPSTYYARLEGKAIWLRASGTPMIEEDSRESPRTFGVIDFVAEPVAKELERIRRQHLERRA